jgi:hypothetical protein
LYENFWAVVLGRIKLKVILNIFHMKINVIKQSIFFLVAGFVLFSGGCSKDVLTKAFNGELDYIQENKVITEYCQGCHNHNIFDRNEHVINVSKLYRGEKYLRAKECHLCHSLKTDMWGYTSHKTKYPRDEEEADKKDENMEK